MNSHSVRLLLMTKGCKLLAAASEYTSELEALAGDSKALREYFTQCVPAEHYLMPGCYLLGPRRLIEENRNLAPSALIFQYGFTAIASTVGGHSIVVDRNSGKVYFADRERFDEAWVMYKDKHSGEWREAKGLSYENILLGLEKLNDDLWLFLEDFIEGRYASVLEKLD